MIKGTALRFLFYFRPMKKILVVCLGNICRSPMAHGLLRDKAEKRGIDLKIESAGTSNFHVDESPDNRAQEKMKSYGYNISDLRGRQFIPSDFEEYDEIFAMDENNYNDIIAQAQDRSEREKVKLFLSEINGENLSVPDPYFGHEDGFEHVFKLLDAASDNLLKRIEDE